jgi:DNA topoisomerase-1
VWSAGAVIFPDTSCFNYLDETRARQTIGSGDVNDYLREITGQDYTSKDFRTWAGTVLAGAAAELRDLSLRSRA